VDRSSAAVSTSHSTPGAARAAAHIDRKNCRALRVLAAVERDMQHARDLAVVDQLPNPVSRRGSGALDARSR